MIITVTINPALDRTIYVNHLLINGLNRVDHVEVGAGGRGINISKTVQLLGGETIAMGVLGGDTGNFIRQTLESRQIPNDFCYMNGTTRTNLKIVDTAMHTSTDINERGETIPDAILGELHDKLIERVHSGDYVVFAGANPPDTEDGLLAKWSQDVAAKGGRVILDTTGKPMREAIHTKPLLIKPNKSELEEICGRRLFFEVDILAEAKALVEEGAERVIVSLGADGAFFVSEDQIIRAYSPKVSVLRQAGSGDTMLGALTLAMNRNLNWTDSIAYCMAASAAHVGCKDESAFENYLNELLPQVRLDELM